MQLTDIFACDAFSGLDDIIIDWALDQLNDEILDASIDGLKYNPNCRPEDIKGISLCRKYKK